MLNDDKEELVEIDNLIKQAKSLGPKKSSKNNVRTLTITKPQQKFLTYADITKREETLEILASGGIGSGKSYALCLLLLNYVQVPGTTVLLVHQYLSMLKKTTLRLLLLPTIAKDGTILEPLLGPQYIEKYNKSDGIITLTNGSQIILSGCTDEEKLRSLNIVAAFIDELTHLSKEVYQSIVQRCRIFNTNPNAVFSATNPSHRQHWCYKHFVDNMIPGYREMLTVSSVSNKDNLPSSYLKNLERLPDLEKKKMMYGEWLNSGNQVFYTFSRDEHTKYMNDWNKSHYDDFIVANDFGGGGENAYSGACLIGRKGNCYFVLEEFNKKKTTHREMLEFLEQYRDITNEVCVYDSANAALGSDLENAGWKTIKSIKDIEGSVSKINSLIKDNRLFISSKCPRLINQLEGAVRNQDTDKINKLHDWDLIDSMRYGVCAFDDDALMDKNSSGNVFVFAL